MDNWDTFEPVTDSTNEIPSPPPPHPQVTTPVYEPYPTPAPVPDSVVKTYIYLFKKIREFEIVVHLPIK